VSANDRKAVNFTLSAGNVHDSVGGFEVLETIGKMPKPVNLLIDRAYEGFNMRKTAFYLNFKTVVPPKENRKDKNRVIGGFWEI